ncbi:MAG TPA: glycosyltransferase [Gaiellaceae bacterium]|nr:glycosyltransferase [Gaiellaceae bacterium]
MKRVLLVAASAKPGGAERAAVALARSLPEHGWELVPVLLEDGPARAWFEPEALLLPAGRTRQLHRTTATVRRLARLARGHEVSAIVSSQSRSHVYGGLAARLAHLPAVWWQHGIPSGSRVDRAAALVPAAAVVCVSEHAAAAQRAFTPRARVAVVHESTFVPSVAPGSRERLRRQLGWEKAPVVGIVGRLEPWKGQELFLRAAALAAADRPELRFAVVGGAVLGWEGDYPRRLEALARRLGIADRVHFAGHQDDVGPWYAALDVVVHASTEEPFGLVLVEAMALGKPLVTASGGAATEIVEDGRSGLVSAHEPAPLAAALARILDEPGLAERLGAGGVERAAHYAPARAAAAFARVLDSVAAESHEGSRRRLDLHERRAP